MDLREHIERVGGEEGKKGGERKGMRENNPKINFWLWPGACYVDSCHCYVMLMSIHVTDDIPSH